MSSRSQKGGVFSGSLGAGGAKAIVSSGSLRKWTPGLGLKGGEEGYSIS